jgi:UDP-N-acetylglucosamine acyltransferase
MIDALAPGEIHETAIVDRSAEIAADASIGPYAVIGPRVVVGPGTRIGPHAVIHQDTILRANCVVHQGASVGNEPQDLKFGGERTEVIIGDSTVVREFVTINRGTSAHGKTEIGSNCLLMAYAHVAHDCIIGDNVVIANSVNMGGHVEIGDWVVVGGMTAIHQFAKIGAHAFVGGMSAVRKDVPPYVKASGQPLKLYGLNSVGLQRRGFRDETRLELKRAYRLFFQSDLNIRQAAERARLELQPSSELDYFLAFLEASNRGLTI